VIEKVYDSNKVPYFNGATLEYSSKVFILVKKDQNFLIFDLENYTSFKNGWAYSCVQAKNYIQMLNKAKIVKKVAGANEKDFFLIDIQQKEKKKTKISGAHVIMESDRFVFAYKLNDKNRIVKMINKDELKQHSH